MKILADSGSTKTDWACITDKGTFHFCTIGMNPYFITTERVVAELSANFPKNGEAASVSEVHFYGSGCGRDESKQVVEKALRVFFPQASISVESDLVGAAVACYGADAGLVAILGTGMNVGYWNGKTLETPLPSLGFILGDEASGADIGKRLVRGVFEKRLPQSLIDAFFASYPISLQELLDKVYKQSCPNAFLAQFAPFVIAHKNESAMQEIINEAFSDLFAYYINPLMKTYKTQKISFVGSIAYALSEYIVLKTQNEKCSLEKIISRPLDFLERKNNSSIIR